MTIERSDLINYANRFSRSMDDYQMEHFVVKSQVTKFRQLQQALIEFRSRVESLDTYHVEKERMVIQKLKWERKLQEETDDLEIRLINLEINELAKNISITDKRIRHVERERGFFENQLLKDFDSVEELENYIEDPENERLYWISRMAKQAAMEMVSQGRIGIGNLDSIAQMGEEDQIKTLQIAIQYSGLLNIGMEKLKQEVVPALQRLEQSDVTFFPSFDGIEKDLQLKIIGDLGNEQRKRIQSSDQSEE